MDKRLGSLARFERINSVRQVDHLVIDMSWATVDDALPMVVQYDTYHRPIIRFSPYAEADQVAPPRECVSLTGEEFLSVLVWLIRRGLLEDVGLVSTETESRADDGPYQCRCTLEPAPVGAGLKPARTKPAPTEPEDDDVRARHAALETASPVQEDGAEDDDEIEMDWPRYFRERELTETSPVQEEEGEEAENEGEPNAPFALPIVELVEGDGDPEWLTDPRVMVYLHHQLELSVTDMARVCDTTYARVKGALKRLGIEQRSYRGGRSKIGPRRDSGSTGR